MRRIARFHMHLRVVFQLVSGRTVPCEIPACPDRLLHEGGLRGVSVCCAFAPRRFLEGPEGTKWMELIGTKNVLTARFVCGALAAIIGAMCGFLIWAAWYDFQKQ